MKLLVCKLCGSVFNLELQEEKTCSCGKTKGKYLDILNAEYSGPCVPLGFQNKSFILAINKSERDGSNIEFTAFTIPSDCNSFKRKEN